MPISPTNIEIDLRKLTFAAEWPDGTVAEIAKLTQQENYPAGSVIFRESEKDDNIHLIVTGRVGLEMSVPARGKIRLLTLSEGDLLGWSPMVGNREMTATAVALSDTRLLTISGPSLLALCERNHEVGYAVMRRLAWALSRRLTATRLQLLDLYSQTAPAVVAAGTEGGPL